MVTRSRPLGVTIISIILFIQGALGVIAGILLLVAGGALASNGHPIATAAVGIGAVIALILAVLTLILAWGLWTLRTWAFWGIVIVEALNIVYGIYSWTQGGNGVVALLLSIAIPVIILLYMLLDRNVRAAFRT